LFQTERKMSDSNAKNPTGPGTGKATPKPSSADYPVEEAERISQQARLRKAAAAGAHALKSPLPSVLARTAPSPSSGSQQVQNPLAESVQGATTQAAEQPSDDPLPGIPTAPQEAGLQAEDDELVLAELRKISAWADLQRRITKWSFIFLAVFIPALIAFVFLMEQRVKSSLEDAPPRQKMDWYEVDQNVRQGDFDKALAIGEELIIKTPLYPEAHQRLGGAYLAAGKLDKAREHYAEAFRLFPSEENEKLLNAIEKRSNAEKP
jgi:tetratricopeptide (TPR) repeat protein